MPANYALAEDGEQRTTKIRSPLRGKYLVRNPLANGVLRCVDRVLAWCVAGRKKDSTPPPRRVLVANGAHLGDVLLSTAVLPALKEAFPGVRIGFLAGSWAQPVLAGHPLLDWVHYVDHWKLNRGPLSLARKLRQYGRTRRRALQAIRQRGYDLAIDLYFHFPNSIPLLWQAGIPVRIGYTSGGFGPLLTHALDWAPGDYHVTDYHADLIRLVPGAEWYFAETRPQFVIGDVPAEATERIREKGGLEDNYLVLHLGAGSALKQWPPENWKKLICRLLAGGHTLVFTGTGTAEKRTIAEVICGHERCVDLCGRLGWPEFAAVIREARLLIGVDSVAGHVAAAVGTPCVVIQSGITPTALWRPLGRLSRGVTRPIACSPCYRSRGCATMDCVRGVSVDDVYRAVRELLPA